MFVNSVVSGTTNGRLLLLLFPGRLVALHRLGAPDFHEVLKSASDLICRFSPIHNEIDLPGHDEQSPCCTVPAPLVTSLYGYHVIPFRFKGSTRNNQPGAAYVRWAQRTGKRQSVCCTHAVYTRGVCVCVCVCVRG